MSESLFTIAKKYLNRAHSPYSKVKVACATLMNDGKIYGGCNIENASYGGTICAERVAITKAVSEGAKSIKAILVLTNQKEIWPPCGICRQVMAEFAKSKTLVFTTNLKGQMITYNFSDLLPGAYTPDYLLK
ncbi:MAG: cytidine deaminase [Bdellovibrionales bacterium]|nr:cytidine deaminase [Bdellovibrionales bacterium]